MMGQISPKLRKIEGGYAHWCPACEEMHGFDGRWKFDGNAALPSFQPSMKITAKQTVKKGGIWTGEWVCGPDGKAVDYCCHYILTAGVIDFQNDCTHAMRGTKVALPDIPAGLKDEAFE